MLEKDRLWLKNRDDFLDFREKCSLGSATAVPVLIGFRSVPLPSGDIFRIPARCSNLLPYY